MTEDPSLNAGRSSLLSALKQVEVKMTEDHARLLTVLKQVEKYQKGFQAGGPFCAELDSSQAICSSVDQVMYEMDEPYRAAHEDIIFDLFVRWPEYSGERKFPVPHPTKSPEEGFYATTFGMWSGEYGEARFRLLRFMIETLEAELCPNTPC